MIHAEFDKADLRRALKALGEVDKKLLTALRKDIRGELRGVMSQIESDVPTVAPLSNMNKPYGLGGGWYPQKAYGPVRVSAAITPGINRTFSGKSNLVSIQVTQIDRAAGFKITENAGTKSKGGSPQGIAFIRNLDSKKRMRGNGGRWAWASYVKNVRQVKKAGERVVEKFAKVLDSEGF